MFYYPYFSELVARCHVDGVVPVPVIFVDIPVIPVSTSVLHTIITVRVIDEHSSISLSIPILGIMMISSWETYYETHL